MNLTAPILFAQFKLESCTHFIVFCSRHLHISYFLGIMQYLMPYLNRPLILLCLIKAEQQKDSLKQLFQKDFMTFN